MPIVIDTIVQQTWCRVCISSAWADLITISESAQLVMNIAYEDSLLAINNYSDELRDGYVT